MCAPAQTASNSPAVGAIVRVKAAIGGKDFWQMRQVSAGGETFRVQHDIRPNFGLGDATVAEVVRIEWPSGMLQELTDVAADQVLTVVEPPRLAVDSTGRVSWPVTADGYELDGAETTDGPWSRVGGAVVRNGDRIHMLVPTDLVARFFRLRKP